MILMEMTVGGAVLVFMVFGSIDDIAAAQPEPEPVAAAEPESPTGMASMDMSAYFTAVSHPLPQDTMMVMGLSDAQSARSGNDFVTSMAMVEYGITSSWSVGVMVEGQKISRMPTTYGGFRINSFVHLFPSDHLLNFTLYGEYEGLNGAALYKMEVAGFGGEDLNDPLASARRTPVRTFEQRAIVYHDWGRLNLTFNFINETGLESGDNDFGFAWGMFMQPAYMGPSMGMAPMPGMPAQSKPGMLSLQRLGYGFEMIGSLGDANQFSLASQRQQEYVGPVFSYTLSDRWNLHVAPTFGLSDVSDPFVLRMGLGYSSEHLLHR
jgi:hypothetical protein